MPEIITIIFDCFNPELNTDPMRVDDFDKCNDANEALIEFLDDHHISYYAQCVTKNELHCFENELLKKGIVERGG